MLEKFKRIKLGHFPTPVEYLKNISKYFDGPNIFIKRDDCTGLATGGNKNGTMEKRLEKEGNLVRAKTGGLSGVSNLSGYIFSPKHGPLAFSILISGYTGSSYQAIQLQNKIVQMFAHD